MTEYWSRWVAFWSESAKALAGFRICTIYCYHYFASQVWIPIWVDAADGGIRHYNSTLVVELLGGLTQQGVERLIVLSICASLGLIIGLGSMDGIVRHVRTNTISWHNPMASGGHDD